jgi:hypothetical protein
MAAWAASRSLSYSIRLADDLGASAAQRAEVGKIEYELCNVLSRALREKLRENLVLVVSKYSAYLENGNVGFW